MKRIVMLCVMLCLLVAGAAVAQDDQGQPNDPETNPRANACFEGGTLEFQCHRTDADRDGDVDREDINFMWWCGWYIIRVQNGMLQAGDYPAQCYVEPVRALVPELACPTEPISLTFDFRLGSDDPNFDLLVDLHLSEEVTRESDGDFLTLTDPRDPACTRVYVITEGDFEVFLDAWAV